ncbi:MAG: hypothetical protein NTX65_11595 [Ignavibacteriales bacterium]|nr:hypothetical protein [Ignavibacteriales bacterium]
MNTKTNNPLIIALIVVIVLFLLFGGGAMSGGMMNGGMHNGLNEIGWMSNRSWMWTPTVLTLVIGVILGWFIFKKKV